MKNAFILRGFIFPEWILPSLRNVLNCNKNPIIVWINKCLCCKESSPLEFGLWDAFLLSAAVESGDVKPGTDVFPCADVWCKQ